VPRTLGPLTDLERHLPTDWWRTLFNAVYLQTDGDVVENAENTRHDIDLFLKSTGAEPADRILDLSCGQGRHTLELARRGYRRVTGVDRSRYLVRLARRRARQADLAATFREGDARKLRLPESAFDVVCVMGNSFGYFEKQDDDRGVLASIKRVLRSRGTLAMDLADGEWLRGNFEPRSWEWIDQDQFVCRERSISEDGQRLISREVVVHAERGVIADQFYAERLYSRETIAGLLDDLGFTELRFHVAPETGSEREQDLGMMARRMFLTTQAPVKVARKRRSAAPLRVTVLLGDPRLPDAVKLGGQFNPEDLTTVEKLKAALAELDGYRFSYLDNHASMMSELRADPPDLVLNLCDEGFGNDAQRELHVPAYLEMLGIPYTGAGPNCLGLCYDKSLTRAVAAAIDVPVPVETFFAPDDQIATIPSVFPALIKPALGDSSMGITSGSIVRTAAEAVDSLNRLREAFAGSALLVQEFLPGAEYTVGVMGNPGNGLDVLPILEVDYTRLPANLPQILSYESKWDPASPYWTDIAYREAEMDDDLRRRLTDHSILLFERLGCRDYARFDFRADADGEVKLLEVNPNPGWCWDGKMNLMAGFADIRYARLLGMVLDAARARLPGLTAAAPDRRRAMPDESNSTSDAGRAETGSPEPREEFALAGNHDSISPGTRPSSIGDTSPPYR
jgi:D-alanine-D-alanine ligase